MSLPRPGDKIDSVQCPVCDRQFSQSIIEAHVNKCIFLNTQTETSLKRGGSYDEDNENVESTTYKRIRTDSDCHVTTLSKEPVIPNKVTLNIILT